VNDPLSAVVDDAGDVESYEVAELYSINAPVTVEQLIDTLVTDHHGGLPGDMLIMLSRIRAERPGGRG
jgi:hypothetical protein